MATAFSDHGSSSLLLGGLSSLESDLLLSDLLSDSPGSPSHFCSCCEGQAPARSHCDDCKELLCDKCVVSHIRIRSNQAHTIAIVSDFDLNTSDYHTVSSNESVQNSSVSSCSPTPGANYCEFHGSELLSHVCGTCSSLICNECRLRDHRTHNFIDPLQLTDEVKSSSVQLLSEANTNSQCYNEMIEILTRIFDNIGANSFSVARDIRAIIAKVQASLRERERELLCKLDKIKQMKQKQIQQQVDGLKAMKNGLNRSIEALAHSLETGSTIDIILARGLVLTEVKKIDGRLLALPLPSEDSFRFSHDSALFMAIANFGDIVFNPTYVHGYNSAEGGLRMSPRPGLHNQSYSDIVPNVTNDISYFLNLSDSLNLNLNMNSDPALPPCRGSGKFRLMDPPAPSKFVRSLVPSGPLGLGVPKRNCRDYSEIGRPKAIFGGDGEKDGQLCRPWGVCCDLKGNIIIADRSNNRIQIFKSDGTFLRKFGTQGSEHGQFDRPAGVCVDSLNQIIVADKDNHRIQVFSGEGQFIFTFGEKGSKVGQFNYPWDVAVDSTGMIIVSDTRNHRVQLFSSDGTFLNKYGYEVAANMWKHFDSPRGVCFDSKGSVIVTDFNNHRLVVIDPDFRTARFLGAEGPGVVQFVRPQGVAVDKDGNIVVADSRNNRIQIIEPNGSFLCQFGSSGSAPGQLDRPGGVCISATGDIIVVDFGNNRIQVF